MSAHAAAKIGQHFGDELTFFKAFTRCWGQPNQAEAKKENCEYFKSHFSIKVKYV
jgi:hypothetical protein